MEGVKALPRLGLDAMELEFVQGVYLKTPEKAREVKDARDAHNVRLTVHAPYTINLNSRSADTMKGSIERLYQACRMGGLAGAESVAVHAAFRHDQTSKEIATKIKNACEEIYSKLHDEKISIKIAPEYAGKLIQWGSLEEVMEIAQEKNISWCMDFGHYHATHNGNLTNKGEFDKVLVQIEKFDSSYLKDMHIQCCGITFSEKGEKYHTSFDSQESTLNWKAMVESFKEFNVKGVCITECPGQEKDTLLLKKYYESL